MKGAKINVVTDRIAPARFTDATESVARFVTATGDSLWNTKEPGQLKRGSVGKEP